MCEGIHIHVSCQTMLLVRRQAHPSVRVESTELEVTPSTRANGITETAVTPSTRANGINRTGCKPIHRSGWN